MAKYLITYDCPACKQDSTRTDTQKPVCFCGNSKGLKERKRELLTREVMAARMRLVAERMMRNLAKAYDIVGTDWKNFPKEETRILQALAAGQDMQANLSTLTEQYLRNR